jgi:poly(A) polymerase/tRNA nucleotidyltransferase (CCA-adding enzyme)
LKNIEQIKKFIPNYIYQISDQLNNYGYKAYLVGGAVRNILLDIEPEDFDIATDAKPEQIEKIFPRSVNVNAKFGTILVIVESESGERFDVEITTFRKEENYFGGRWPSTVEFTDDLRIDLSRRDFTINAMAIDLNMLNKTDSIIEEIVIDYYNGIDDLKNRLIRAVGSPIERFTEDGLRPFRACRFASVYGFIIEEETFNSIKETLHVAKMVSIERVRDEFIKLVYNSPQPSYGMELLRKSGLLEIFLPELLLGIGVVQPKFHTDDLYVHSIKTMDAAEDSVKIAALFHDIGKIYTQTEDEKGIHFYGHDVIGAQKTEEILTRLRFPKAEIKRISNLIRWHMFYYPSAEWRKENVDVNDITNYGEGGWNDPAIRRFVMKVGEEALEDLFKLRIADAGSNEKSNFDENEIEVFSNRISEVRSKDMALKVGDLDIKGEDLIGIGIESGPIMGKVLYKLLDIVIEDPGMNNKDLLLQAAKSIIKENNF